MIQPPCIHEYTKRQRKALLKRKVGDAGFTFFFLFVLASIVWFYAFGGFTGGVR